jgi:hypothetical protein
MSTLGFDTLGTTRKFLPIELRGGERRKEGGQRFRVARKSGFKAKKDTARFRYCAYRLPFFSRKDVCLNAIKGTRKTLSLFAKRAIQAAEKALN